MLADSRAKALMSPSAAAQFASVIGKLPFLEARMFRAQPQPAGRHTAFKDVLAKGSPSWRRRRPPATTLALAVFLGLDGMPRHGTRALEHDSHRGVVRARRARYKESDVVFSAAKLFFAYGLGNALSFTLAVGATAC